MLTQQEWDEFLQGVKLSGLGLHRYKLSADADSGSLRLIVEVDDADGDGTARIATSARITGYPPEEQVWSLWINFLGHEAGENFWVDGERPRYPNHTEENDAVPRR